MYLALVSPEATSSTVFQTTSPIPSYPTPQVHPVLLQTTQGTVLLQTPIGTAGFPSLQPFDLVQSQTLIPATGPAIYSQVHLVCR